MRTNAKALIQFSVVVFALLVSCEERMDEERPMNQKEKTVAKATSSARMASNYRFTGQEGDPISYDIAKKWVSNYQEKNSDGTMAHFFGYEIIKDILALEGCMGIRMYYALDDSGERQIILVGVDENGNNIVPGTNGRTKDEGVLADASFPCPSYCSGGGTPL